MSSPGKLLDFKEAISPLILEAETGDHSVIESCSVDERAEKELSRFSSIEFSKERSAEAKLEFILSKLKKAVPWKEAHCRLYWFQQPDPPNFPAVNSQGQTSQRTEILTLTYILRVHFLKKQCNSERAKEEASNKFDKLFDVLEERRTSALRAIEASKNLRLEKLLSQKEEYQGLLENNGLVGYAQEVLKETDQSCFVQTAKQLHDRIQKATESLKSFRPAAQTSFEDYVIDIAKQQEIIGDLCFHSNGADIPEINEDQSKIYNKALICWDHPQKAGSADTYILGYRKLSREESNPAWQETEVFSKSEVISDLDTNSSYAFRVRGYKGSISSPWSKEVTLHTPPAPVFSFLFDDKCGYNSERLVLNTRRNVVESRAGFALLLGAERIQTGCYTSLDYIVGDTGIMKGKHFWAFRVEPYSYFVKAGVASHAKIQEWFHNSRDLTSPRLHLRNSIRERTVIHQEEKGQKEEEGGRKEKSLFPFTDKLFITFLPFTSKVGFLEHFPSITFPMRVICIKKKKKIQFTSENIPSGGMSNFWLFRCFGLYWGFPLSCTVTTYREIAPSLGIAIFGVSYFQQVLLFMCPRNTLPQDKAVLHPDPAFLPKSGVRVPPPLENHPPSPLCCPHHLKVHPALFTCSEGPDSRMESFHHSLRLFICYGGQNKGDPFSAQKLAVSHELVREWHSARTVSDKIS
ncbi:E3 ubiquitin-protein ligase TRIM36 [Varanus komodoensis]|nr:E3 ubiquitin-protein ligase TRIM36 [Varanus komodoensis]